MDIKVIKNEKDYDRALAEIERLILANPTRGSADADRLELLGLVVATYEDKRHPIDAPDPIEAIKFVMDQNDLKAKDLVDALGAKSRVSEVLNRKRRLTQEMMWALHDKFGIPARTLIRPYALKKAAKRKVTS